MNSPSVPIHLLHQVKEDAKTSNVKMLSDKYGFTYDAMYNFCRNNRINTANVRNKRQNYGGPPRRVIPELKPGMFNVDANVNWLIGGHKIKKFSKRN